MKKLIWVVFGIVVVLLFLGIVRNRINTLKQSSGDYTFSFQHQGVERTYYVHIPPSYDEKKATPVVLNFHGGGGSPEGHRDITGMDAIADKEGFIVVYPRGTRPDGDIKKRIQRFWNVGEGPTGWFNDNGVIRNTDDVGFVSTMINNLEEKFSVDKSRIYATGFSNGAIFTYSLVCELSDRIAAIAPVGAPFWNFPGQCRIKKPVSVLHFHGTDDTCAPFHGGPSGCEAGLANTGRIFPSVNATVETWKEKNNCGDEGRVVYDKGEVTCTGYVCKDNAEVILCTIQGGGHTWPGGKPYAIPGFDIGKTTQDINANEFMWEFFKRHEIR